MRIENFSTTGIVLLALLILITMSESLANDKRRVRGRQIGIDVGTMRPGQLNSVTDVPGVLVGHKTIIRGSDIRTGVTAILPHSGNIFQEKVPAAIFVGNGFGKLVGYTQVTELGNIETPIILTNTLSVGTAMTAVVNYTLSQPGNEQVRSVNAVVGETNDGYLNDIRGFHVTENDVIDAIKSARTGVVEEGSVGAGTGTRAFGYKGGIGTSSRLITNGQDKQYTVGVIVQSNYGGSLDINGAPVGLELLHSKKGEDVPLDGSCMIAVATDAPLSPRNLRRLAERALYGLARTGSSMSNGSGDYVIAFSTAYRIPYKTEQNLQIPALIPNDDMTPLFQGVMEATREAVYNSLLMATTIKGYKDRVLEAIPVEEVIRICEKYGALNIRQRLIRPE